VIGALAFVMLFLVPVFAPIIVVVTVVLLIARPRSPSIA
jgi:hypothetical protein